MKTKKELLSEFGQKVKYLREVNKLSQEELAENAGFDRTYISLIERGLRNLSLYNIYKFTQAFKLKISDIFMGNNNMENYKYKKIYDSDELMIKSSSEKITMINTDKILEIIHKTNSTMQKFDEFEVDVYKLLEMRNLSAFFGAIFVSVMEKEFNDIFLKNPHQDGYPDLLLLDDQGKRDIEQLKNKMNDKSPFSPFKNGGIEVKATCGSIPTPKELIKKGFYKPGVGDSRISFLKGYDWKAHHRETNNLLGILWDFVNKRPVVIALFYSDKLQQEDWGKIIKPKEGGGKTTSVSIMTREGVKKMYNGCLFVFENDEYIKFINRHNSGDLLK